MGKTIIYVALLCILGAGVYYFFFKDKDGALFHETEANFTIRDTSIIGKIFLVDNEGTSILLERGNDNKWILNKQYPAMRMQMINILTCMKMQTAFTPVPERDYDRVIKMLAGLSTKVEVYDRQGNKIRCFYVAGQGPNYHGSYMMLENAKQPYLVEIQGFDGYLTPRYSTQFLEWRSRAMIELTESEIESISVNYLRTPEHSFVLNNNPNGPEVVLNEAMKSKITSSINLKRVKDYLNFFKSINAEGYLNGAKDLEANFKNATLSCNLKVNARGGQKNHYDIYLIHHDNDDQAVPDGMPYDVERMYAVNLLSKDTLLIQNQTFDKILQSGSVFFQH